MKNTGCPRWVFLSAIYPRYEHILAPNCILFIHKYAIDSLRHYHAYIKHKYNYKYKYKYKCIYKYKSIPVTSTFWPQTASYSSINMQSAVSITIMLTSNTITIT